MILIKFGTTELPARRGAPQVNVPSALVNGNQSHYRHFRLKCRLLQKSLAAKDAKDAKEKQEITEVSARGMARRLRGAFAGR